MANEGIILNLRAWRSSFKIGFSQRIKQRVAEQIRKAELGKITSSEGQALMLLPLYEKSKNEIAQYKKEMNIKLKYSNKSKFVRSTSGYNSGRTAAENVSLKNNAIGGTTKAFLN